MKSVQIKKYGSSEVIEINQSAPEPIVSVGKVLVIVKAAGVNPIDWKIREGYNLLERLGRYRTEPFDVDLSDCHV